MSRARLQFAAGSFLLFVGASLLAGSSLYRNLFVQRAASLIDMSDRVCRKASVAKGAGCPDGCVARPVRQPSDRYRVPECRSRLWVMTCGSSCSPIGGFIRLPDGRLASAGLLEVELSEGADLDAFSAALEKLGARADSSLSGLYRYRVSFPNPNDAPGEIERIKTSLEGEAGVVRVAYDAK